MSRRVEPTHFGFALGINVIVDVENLPAECPFLVEQFRQRLEAVTGLGRRCNIGVFGYSLAVNAVNSLQFGRRHFVDAIDDDGVGFFELLAEDVRGLGREARAGFVGRMRSP